ncbi:hypothetical protein C8P68_1129 [Mucilaginibacter yixingensis]|uniref:Uncharacterized protein n=1 Tax=Mucilaginibacter yixingensis TaxID=1295612 RepID=A0A2T5J4P1_9SPHI|nr:hypothetical protein [Mucilaginibacter yixingensis]PTQ92409.1 hypothetical protein C8P68_1129 [Mucilaginibacter yixingensis]
MTLYEFNILSPKEQEIATVNGEFLETRKEAGQTVALYSISNFFVELWYDCTQNKITRLNSFKSISRLDPYVSQIHLKIDLY